MYSNHIYWLRYQINFLLTACTNWFCDVVRVWKGGTFPLLIEWFTSNWSFKWWIRDDYEIGNVLILCFFWKKVQSIPVEDKSYLLYKSDFVEIGTSTIALYKSVSSHVKNDFGKECI